MRIFVYEFVTGGGLAGRPVPRALARAGTAMRSALLDDLAAMKQHQIVATTDIRFVRPAPSSVELVSIDSNNSAVIDACIAASDAVWLIAPEADRCLERVAARLQRLGTMVLGCGARAVRAAADKSRLPVTLARAGIRHPETVVLTSDAGARAAARRLGYPVVIKPALGAGCEGVRLARHPHALSDAIAAAHRANGRARLVMQRYIGGVPASVSLLADGRRAVAVAVNAQRIAAGRGFAYRGGSTPIVHRDAVAAADVAARACVAVSGLRGFVGIDLVLSETGPVVIEVNPRITMAYLGIRAAIDENLGALALSACRGRLPAAPPPLRRRTRFTAAGRVYSVR